MKFLIVVFFGMLLLNCSENNQDYADTLKDCNANREKFKDIDNFEATIFFFEKQNVYALRYSPESNGTQIYDSVVYAITCNLNNDLKESGTKVVFSGRLEFLSNSEKESFAPIPSGTEMYALKLNTIKSVK